LVDLPAEHNVAELVKMQNGSCAACKQDFAAASKSKVRSHIHACTSIPSTRIALGSVALSIGKMSNMW